jgi:2,5-diamino-6-(ribosylamino)-4(3H)-pyrimidinone 5'-phosphate reductase
MFPRVIIFNVMSVDGRIDGFQPDEGLYYQLAGSWEADAMLSGSATMLAAPIIENEQEIEEQVTEDDDKRPILAIVDSRGQTRVWRALRTYPYWRGFVALCSKSTPAEYLDYLKSENIDYIIAGEVEVDLRVALEEMNSRYEVQTVRVDSGGTLNGVLLRNGLVNEVSVLIAPSLVGGTSPASIFTAPDVSSAGEVIALDFMSVEAMEGGYIWLRYAVKSRFKGEKG